MTLRRATQEDGRAVADVLIRSRQAAAGSIPAAIHSDAEIQEWVEVEVHRPPRGMGERHGFIVVEATGGSGNEEKQPDLRLVWPAA